TPVNAAEGRIGKPALEIGSGGRGLGQVRNLAHLPSRLPTPRLPDTVPQPDLGLSSPRKQHALALFAGLPRHYDAAGAALSCGQDPRWRRALVAAVAPGSDQRVLDVATGTG